MNETSEAKKQFGIQKLYIKDASFESPTSPKSFSFKKWNPKIELNLSNDQAHIDGDIYEVVLCVTLTVSHEETTAFLVEVHQAGLFEIAGFDDEQKGFLLSSQCMTILFPYAREAVSDLSVRGGFPPLTMSPVNFDAIYQKHLQNEQAEEDETGAPH